jgi:hypothetical protein
LSFHLLLQQIRGLFQEANIHGSVAHQVAMTARASESLKQDVLIARPSGSRRRRPQALQRDAGAPQFASGKMDGKKWQDQVKAVGVAAQQDEVVVVTQGRESGLTAFAHVANSVRGASAGLVICCRQGSVRVATALQQEK